MKKTIIITLVVAIFSFAFVETIFAYPVHEEELGDIVIEPTEIEIYTTLGESTANTIFHIIPQVNGLAKIKLSTFGLSYQAEQDTDKSVIKASQIVFSPNEIVNAASTPSDPVYLLIGERQEVEVSISGIKKPGDWIGEVTFTLYNEVTKDISDVKIDLLVHVSQPALELEPQEEIILSGWQNDTSLEYHITLHETSGNSSVTDMEVFKQSLRNEDDSAFFPKTGIDITLPEKIDPAGNGEIDFLFDLSKAKESGNYSGNIIIQSANTEDISIPIKIEIKKKDCIIFPLILLLFGLGIGWSLNYIQNHLLTNAEILKSIDQLNLHLKENGLFEEYCGTKVEKEIEKVKGFLEKDNPTEARKVLKEAEDLWEKWKDYRLLIEGAIEKLKSMKEIIKNTGEEFTDIYAVSMLISDIESFEITIPNLIKVNPTDLKKEIEKKDGLEPRLIRLINVYTEIKKQQDNLQKANKNDQYVIDVGEKAQYDQGLNRIWNEYTSFDAEMKLTELEKELKSLIDNIGNAILKGYSNKKEYENKFSKSTEYLKTEGSIDDGNITKAIEYVSEYLNSAKECADHNQWNAAIEKIYKGIFAAQACNLLKYSYKTRIDDEDNKKWETVIKAERDLASWLTFGKNYLRAQDDFSSLVCIEIKKLIKALSDTTGHIVPFDRSMLQSRMKSGKYEFREGRNALAWFVPKSFRAEKITEGEPIREERENPHIWEASWWKDEQKQEVLKWIIFIPSFAVLGYIGIKELYLDVPNFGANRLFDYFKVFIWGFGSEASSEGITNLIRNLGFTNLRGKQD